MKKIKNSDCIFNTNFETDCSKEHIHKAIIKEYNGKNALQLAQKYNYSERSIWRILKSDKK